MAEAEVEIIIEKHREDGGATSSFSSLFDFKPMVSYQADLASVMSMAVAFAARSSTVFVVPTAYGNMKVKMDTTNMSDKQIGALAKFLQNIDQVPEARQAFDSMAKWALDKNYAISVDFRYGNKKLVYNDDGKTTRLDEWGVGERGKATGGFESPGNYKVVLNINPAIAKSTQDFMFTALHEVFHPARQLGGYQGTVQNEEDAADNFAASVMKSKFADASGTFIDDTLEYAEQTVARGSAGNDAIAGSSGRDNLHGGSGNDILTAGAGMDFLGGDAGNDRLDAGDGADWIEGDAGMDTLVGGAGANMMLGGLDADTYVSTSGYGDKIVEHGGVDRLDLSYISIDDVVFGREYNDLVMNGGLQLRVGGHYNASGRVEQFTFAEGTYAASFIEYLVSGGSGPGEWTAKPVVLDLDGDGVGLISAEKSRARFDVDSDGDVEKIGWMEAGDGMLVLDRDGDGRISGFAEISFVQDFLGADTDLEGLYAYDSDGDGFLSKADARFDEFQIWVDGNSNGHSEAKELFSLTELGIARLSLETLERGPWADGTRDAQIVGLSFFERVDGSQGELADVAFRVVEGPDPQQRMQGTHEQMEPFTSQLVIA